MLEFIVSIIYKTFLFLIACAVILIILMII